MSPGAAAPPRTTTTALHLVLVVVTAALSWPLVSWAGRRFTEPGTATSIAMIVAGLWSLSRLSSSLSPSLASSRRRVIGLVAAVAVAFVVAVAARVHVAQAVVVGAAVVVTVVVVRGARLADGFTALALFTLAMPARGDLDTFIGFPLRRLAADGASMALSPWLGDVGRETVLVLEGRVADVEVACSGLSTLWIAVAAALVLGQLARRARRWRWPVLTQMTAVVVTVVVLVAMTTVRVAILAAIALAPTSLSDGARQLIGSIVHVPLGLIALLVAVGAAVLVQRFAPRTTTTTTTTSTTTTTTSTTALLTPLLLTWLATSAVGAAVRPTTRVAFDKGETDAHQHTLARRLEAIGGERVALSTAEQALYGRHAEAAVKLRLADGGSLLAVQATRATAHHAPERCLGSAGHEIGAVFDVDDDHGAFRVIVLDGGRALSVSFYASATISGTIAGLGERMALAWRAQLRGAPPPSVTFVSVIWPRASDVAVLDDNELHRARALRENLARLWRTDLSAVEHR